MLECASWLPSSS